MDISFNCDMCGQNLVVDEAGAGRVIDCPKCGLPLTVPSQAQQQAEPSAAPPPSTGGVIAVSPQYFRDVLRAATPPQAAGSSTETKQCPFCAETIKREAKVCRFCGRDLDDKMKAGAMFQSILLLIAVILLGYIAYMNSYEYRQVTTSPEFPDISLQIMASLEKSGWTLYNTATVTTNLWRWGNPTPVTIETITYFRRKRQ